MEKRHAGPWDRGTADSWYGRGYHPHRLEGSDKVTDLTVAEVEEYRRGFAWNEADPGARKQWD